MVSPLHLSSLLQYVVNLMMLCLVPKTVIVLLVSNKIMKKLNKNWPLLLIYSVLILVSLLYSRPAKQAFRFEFSTNTRKTSL